MSKLKTKLVFWHQGIFQKADYGVFAVIHPGKKVKIKSKYNKVTKNTGLINLSFDGPKV